jgi:hypothetical protein
MMTVNGHHLGIPNDCCLIHLDFDDPQIDSFEGALERKFNRK